MDVDIVTNKKCSLKYCKIIYLDQWVWVKLARVHYGKRSDNSWTEAYRRVLNAAACQLAIFPLDFCRFTEILHIPDLGKRLRLANFVFLISGGYTLIALPLLQEMEIMSFLAQQKVDIEKIRNNGLIGTNLEHMMGWEGEISPEDCNLPEDVLKHLSGIISHPKIIWCSLLHGGADLWKNYTSKMKGFIKMLEEIRLRAKNNFQYNEIIDVNWYEVGKNYIAKMFAMASSLTPKPQIPSLRNKEKVLYVLKSIPTLNVIVKLTTTRDVLNRPVDRNDTLDLGYLYSAIPYCDFVFTEKFWAKQANDCKLGVEYKTIISSKPEKLIEFLPDSGFSK